MLDYGHGADDLSMSCRELTLDSARALRSGSISSYASSDSGLRLGETLSSAGLKRSIARVGDDSDCDSDASGEYEPLRASSSGLSARSTTPPPPPPPPRPRCNSLHAPRPPASPTSVASGHFGTPPQASRSLDDLSDAPADPAPVAGRKNLARFLGMNAPVSPRRFGALWRRWTERTVRAGPALDSPPASLNKSLPNLRSAVPASAGTAAAAAAAVARGALSLASTPRSVSPSRSRISPGALHRALKRVQERTLRRSRGHRDPHRDGTPALMAVTRLTSRGAAREPSTEPEKFAPAVATPKVEREGCRIGTGKRRISFESVHFSEEDVTEGRTVENLADTAEENTAVSALPAIVVNPPSIVVNPPAIVVNPPAIVINPPWIAVNSPENAQQCRTERDRLGQDSLDQDRSVQDDDGYMTMDAMRAILRAPPPAGLLHVPDSDPVTSDGDPVTSPAAEEPGYLDMAGIWRLRRAFAASLASQTQPAPPARPARRPRVPRDERFVSARDASTARADYANVSDLHKALQALHRADRPAISEDE